MAGGASDDDLSTDLPIEAAQTAGVRHGRSSTFLLPVLMAALARIFGSLEVAGERAFGRQSDVEVMASRDGDVFIRVTTAADGLEANAPDEEPREVWPALSMLPRLGLLADRQFFAANLDALGHRSALLH